MEYPFFMKKIFHDNTLICIINAFMKLFLILSGLGPLIPTCLHKTMQRNSVLMIQ